MSHSNNVAIAALIATVSLGACVVEEDAVELGSHVQKATTANGLPYNGLPYNGLPYNGLPYNGLPYNGLPYNGLPYNGLSSATVDQDWSNWLNDPSRGDLNDTLMTYVARCALDSNDGASYTDGNGNTWEWDGELGLAPGWTTGGLTVAEQRWITACVASLVNEYGFNTQISQRGPVVSLFNVKVPEVKKWDLMEAAFFGNMFDSTPTLYSCIHSNSYQVDPDGRNCGLTDENDENRCVHIEVLGLCEDICDTEIMSVANKDYTVYKNCVGADGVNYGTEVITTALRD